MHGSVNNSLKQAKFFVGIRGLVKDSIQKLNRGSKASLVYYFLLVRCLLPEPIRMVIFYEMISKRFMCLINKIVLIVEWKRQVGQDFQ